MSSERILFIVRHAKSSWDYEDVSDLDRPLKLKGVRDAYETARQIKLDGNLPVRLISSPAIRALHTASIFMRVLELKFTYLAIDERLYSSGVSVIKKVISEQDSHITKLMIFGHNPDFSELASALSGKPYVEMPTCGLCKIFFDTDNWGSISSSQVKEVVYGYPVNENLE
jgi:phosphohistidine phosphatase